MIVWSGRGFFSIIILIVVVVVCMALLPKENTDYSISIACFATAFFSWFFGKKWNSQNKRIVLDEKTRERIVLTNNHSLFWIPMQYWGIIFSILGIIALFQNSAVYGFIAALLLVSIMLIVWITKEGEEE